MNTNSPFIPPAAFKPSPAFIAWLDMVAARYPMQDRMPLPEMLETHARLYANEQPISEGPEPMTTAQTTIKPTQTPFQLGQEGAQRAADHADRVHGGEFTVKALAAIRAYAWSHERFTVEDVREELGEHVPTPPDPRAWGAVIRKAVREGGICEKIGVTNSTSKTQHGGYVSVYKSLCLFAE